jgi:hypothetical protein
VEINKFLEFYMNKNVDNVKKEISAKTPYTNLALKALEAKQVLKKGTQKFEKKPAP